MHGTWSRRRADHRMAPTRQRANALCRSIAWASGYHEGCSAHDGTLLPGDDVPKTLLTELLGLTSPPVAITFVDEAPAGVPHVAAACRCVEIRRPLKGS